MNLPTTLENEVFNKLPESLKPFVKARLEPSVKSLTDNDLKFKCLNLITQSFAEQGQLNIEAQMLNFQKEALFTELRTQARFKDLTWSEVQSAFKTGVRGELGPFFGMCAKTYHQFLKYYADKKERVEGMRQYLDMLNEPKKTEKPIAVKLAETEASYKTAFEHYKLTKDMPFTSFAFYDFLTKDKGMTLVTLEEKREIAKQAEVEYTSELKMKKAQGLIRSEQYESIITNLSTNPTLKNKMKKLALKKYWESLINNKL